MKIRGFSIVLTLVFLALSKQVIVFAAEGEMDPDQVILEALAFDQLAINDDIIKNPDRYRVALEKVARGKAKGNRQLKIVRLAYFVFDDVSFSREVKEALELLPSDKKDDNIMEMDARRVISTLVRQRNLVIADRATVLSDVEGDYKNGVSNVGKEKDPKARKSEGVATKEDVSSGGSLGATGDSHQVQERSSLEGVHQYCQIWLWVMIAAAIVEIALLVLLWRKAKSHYTTKID